MYACALRQSAVGPLVAVLPEHQHELDGAGRDLADRLDLAVQQLLPVGAVQPLVAGAGGVRDFFVADDLGYRRDPVLLHQPRDQARRAVHLWRRRQLLISGDRRPVPVAAHETPDQADADAVVVRVAGVIGAGFGALGLVDGPVGQDDVVVADAGPLRLDQVALIVAPFAVDVVIGDLAHGKCRRGVGVVDDDTRGRGWCGSGRAAGSDAWAGCPPDRPWTVGSHRRRPCCFAAARSGGRSRGAVACSGPSGPALAPPAGLTSARSACTSAVSAGTWPAWVCRSAIRCSSSRMRCSSRWISASWSGVASSMMACTRATSGSL